MKKKILSHTHLQVLILLFCSLILNSFSQQPNQHVYKIGEVRATGRSLYTIAVPSFTTAGGSAKLQKGTFSSIIYNDLELSGFFQRVKGQNYINEQHILDIRSKKINHAEWRRLRTNFLVRGTYTLTAESISAKVELWESGKGIRIFGREYSNYGVNQWRTLAHKISDDIHYYVTSKRGVANTKIAYVQGVKSNRGRIKEINVMDADGSNIIRLTNEKNLVATPCWGMNGAEIFFTTYKDFNPDLARISINGGKTSFISRRSGFNLSPNWNSATKRIVLTLGKDGNSEIYTMDRNGKGLKRLTWSKAIDSSPNWFPNGRQIVFTSDRTGGPQIYVMDKDGVNTRRLTHQGTYNDSAVVSPKGDRIAFTGRSRGIFNIYTMDINGQNWVQLTGAKSNQGNNEDPSWSPNGEQLVFTSDRRGGVAQIFIMNADGSQQKQITSKGMNHSPVWSPIYE